MIKTLKIIIISLAAWSLSILVGNSFAQDTTIENQALKQIQTYFVELSAKLNAWEITQDKFAENLRNRILIMKEMYWDKISEEFYNKMLSMADGVKKSKDQILKIAKNLTWSNQTQTSTTTLNAKDKSIVENLISKYLIKINKLEKTKQKTALNKLITQIDTLIKKIEKDTKKVNIKNMLNYMKESFTNKLSEISK